MRAHALTPARVYAPRRPLATFILAHGAGAGQSSGWIVGHARGLSERGLRVVTFDFPGARQNAPLERAYLRVIDAVRARFPSEPLVIGGKSMGGRIASQVAAAGLDVCALVFFGYPLHPPGDAHKRRDVHLPNIRAPMLFVSGTRDPFASVRELRALAKTLGASLSLVETGDHSLLVTKSSGLVQRAVDTRVWEDVIAFVTRSVRSLQPRAAPAAGGTRLRASSASPRYRRSSWS